MTDISELRGKSSDELKDMAISLKKELFNLRFQTASGEAANTARYRLVRRDIARVKTLLNEPKDMAVKKPAKPAVKQDKAAKKAKAAAKAEAARHAEADKKAKKAEAKKAGATKKAEPKAPKAAKAKKPTAKKKAE